MSTIKGMPRVLVIAQTSNALGFVFKQTRMVFDQTPVVVALPSYNAFAILQSRLHLEWVLLFSATMKDDRRYLPSDCFETFPFPPDWENHAMLEREGKECYECRADLMVHNNEGLTATGNRFHNPDERSPEIINLRELHDAMDRAVLHAYGWTDLKPTCEFILDYEEENDDGKPSRKKKPWRYRWPDEFRDEVLARLLGLNQERAAEENAMALNSESPKTRLTKGAKRRSSSGGAGSLFD